MDSKIGFEMSLIVVEAIRGRCASFTVLTATVSEIFGGQSNSSILEAAGNDISRRFGLMNSGSAVTSVLAFDRLQSMRLLKMSMRKH